MGLYNANYSQILPKEPTFFIAKSGKKIKETVLPQIKSQSFQKYRPKKLYEEGEFEDERLLFAKIMKGVSNDVHNSLSGTEENLGIESELDYRYSHTKDFVKGFHEQMKKGFEYVKKRVNNIKLINEQWERDMFHAA